MKKLALGVMLAIAALHPAYADQAIVLTTWEAHAFLDVDGVRKVDQPIKGGSFATLEECIGFAVKQPEPPAPKEALGHTVVEGYTCVKTETPAMVTHD